MNNGLPFALVESYLWVNEYFAVTEYLVIEGASMARTADALIVVFRIPRHT